MSGELFRLCDDLGPSKIVHLSNMKVGLESIVVIDNTACGPAIGGTRMGRDVSVEECTRLARAMTLKNSAAGLPHGGAKSVIFADPAMEPAAKEELIRAFASAIRNLADYIPGPDMGTNEVAMAWIQDEIGRSVGLPREIGGIPLDDIGATGFGLSIAAEVAEEFCALKLSGARVVVQGFGAVGTHAARFLARKGATLIAASDSHGAIFNAHGLDVEAVIAHKKAAGSVKGYVAGQPIDPKSLVSVECDIWIPAARPDVITMANAGELRCKLLLQGANIPASPEAEAQLHERSILTVPDFIANAGGVICASVEYHGGTQASALAMIEEKIRHNVGEVLASARDNGEMPRTAALRLAKDRVRRAMELRRW
ncbi:MAG TPA: Glu/Leu/Phe/Val dehydrogenase [Hyphomicrobium sp.]|nr:Glu/Leu/Phe/Val dehydrogenase [Hyphomicrobium sp.]